MERWGGNLWTFLLKSSISSLCLPVRSCFQKLIQHTSPLSLSVHSALWNIYKWICFQFQGWPWSTGSPWCSDHQWWLCERSRKMFTCFSLLIFCAPITIIAKLKQNVIRPNWLKFWTYFTSAVSRVYWWLFTESWENTKTELNSNLHMNEAVRISCIFNPSECCTNSGPENKASTVHLSDYYTSMLGSNVKNSQRNFVLIAFMELVCCSICQRIKIQLRTDPISH